MSFTKRLRDYGDELRNDWSDIELKRLLKEFHPDTGSADVDKFQHIKMILDSRRQQP